MPVYPGALARQHRPSPLHRHPQHKAIGAFRERVYHRTVRSVLTVCLTKRGNPIENITSYLRHRITNANSESINARVQWVKYTARGFRNKQNFINALYFHCGDLELAP